MLATTRYIADGVRDSFRFSFAGGYMQPQHVKVSVDGTLLPPSAYSVFAQTVLLATTPAAGALVTVYRDSNRAALAVAWGSGVGAEARAEDLETEYRHLLFLTQELSDLIGSIETIELAAPGSPAYRATGPASGRVSITSSSPAVSVTILATMGLIRQVPMLQATDPTWSTNLDDMTRTAVGKSVALIGDPVAVTVQPRYAVIGVPAGAGCEIGVVAESALQAGISTLYNGALAGNPLSPADMAAVIRQCDRVTLRYPDSGWWDLESGTVIDSLAWGPATLGAGYVLVKVWHRDGAEVGVRAVHVSSLSATSVNADVIAGTFWTNTDPVRIFVIMDDVAQITAPVGLPVHTPGSALDAALGTDGCVEVV